MFYTFVFSVCLYTSSYMGILVFMQFFIGNEFYNTFAILNCGNNQCKKCEHCIYASPILKTNIAP